MLSNTVDVSEETTKFFYPFFIGSDRGSLQICVKVVIYTFLDSAVRITILEENEFDILQFLVNIFGLGNWKFAVYKVPT